MSYGNIEYNKLISYIIKESGIKLKSIRDLLGLSVNKVAKRTGLSNSTIDNVEKGTDNTTIESIGILIHFYGFRFDNFFEFSSPLPSKEVLLNRMKRFHKQHKSNAIDDLQKQPNLIDLIEEELIPAGLFDDWKTVKQVQDYCSERYGYAYPSATGTLNTAVKNGLLKQHPSNSPKEYKKG